MIDPTAKSLRLLTVSETSSHKVAGAEMHKVADFIHCWLYGTEPASGCMPKTVRVKEGTGHLSRETLLN
jgi:hypothetical protein